MSPRAAWRLEQLGYTTYDYVAGKADWLAAGLPTEGTAVAKEARSRVGSVLDSSVPTCAPDELVADVARRTRAAGADTCVVVNERRVVLGVLADARLAGHDSRPVAEVMREGPSTVRADVDLRDLVERMTRAGTAQIVVTTPAGELLGLLRREAAEEALARQA